MPDGNLLLAMWSLRTFGELKLQAADGRASPTAARQRSRLVLLAILASSGEQGVERDRLLALLWPESDLDRARAALKQSVYVIRQDLGQEAIRGTDVLSLDRSLITADVTGFLEAMAAEDYAGAAALRRGAFLDGVHSGGAAFEEWRDACERRYAQMHVDALERLARDAERRGDVEGAVRWWRDAVTADPFSARIALGLMHSLEASGDRPAALRHAHLHATLLRSQLDAPPDPLVASLAATLRDAPSPAPVASAAARRAEPPGEPGVAAALPISRAPAAPRSRPLVRVVAVAAAGIVFVAPLATTTHGTVHVVTRHVSERKEEAAALTAHVESAILTRLPALRRGGGWRGRAQHQVELTVAPAGDSVRVAIAALTSAGRFAFPTPYTVPAGTDPRHWHAAVGERAAILVATAGAPLLRRWGALASLPETWAAFQALQSALDSWIASGTGSNPGVFDRVAALDTTSATPLVLAALARAKVNQNDRARVALEQARMPSRRQGPWDRAVARVVDAWLAQDLPAAHAASHALDSLVPRSEWSLLLAWDALAVGRAAEALAVLDSLPADAPWTVHWQRVVRHQARLWTGDFARAAADAEAWLERQPEDLFLQQAAAKALAALGRTDEVEQLCRRSLSQRFRQQPCLQSVDELRHYGHPAAARRVAEVFLSALGAADSLTPVELNEERAFVLAYAGAYDEARTAYQRIPASRRGVNHWWLEAVLAAVAGDTAAVARLVPRFAPGATDDLLDRAGILALLGARDSAVTLIQSAYRHGARRGFAMSAWFGMERLRGYPPYHRVLTPEPDDHLARVKGIRPAPR